MIESPASESGAHGKTCEPTGSGPLSPTYIWVALLASIILYLLVAIHSSQRRLWHDELFTLYIANSSSLSELWRNIRLDLNPPLIYLAVRASIKVFGPSELAVRLPSILAFLTGSLCFYGFVTKRLNPHFGLLALLVLWANPFAVYATEARPYGLIIGFLGVAMLSWQMCREEPRKPFAPALLAFAVVGLMMSHFFAVFYIAPFLFAEFFRWFRTRKVDITVWTVLLIPCSLPFLYLATIKSYRSNDVFPAEFRASLRHVLHFFDETLQPESMILFIALVLAVLTFSRDNTRRPASGTKFRPVEVAFFLALLALPIYLNLVLMRSHSGFHSRYAIPTIFVYPVLVVAVLARYSARNWAAIVASAVLFIYIVQNNFDQELTALLHRQSIFSISPPTYDPVQKIDPSLPLVAASGLTFLEMDHYASPETVSRLYYLTDRELAVRIAHATIFEGFAGLKQHFPIRASVQPYREFVAQHPQFLVLGTAWYPEDWIIPYLMDIHAKLVYLGNFPSVYKDWQLYQVTMPNGEPQESKPN